MSTASTAPAWNSEVAISNALAQYRSNSEQVQSALQKNANERDQLVTMKLTLDGAVGALEQLLTNKADEAKAVVPPSVTDPEPDAGS